MNYNVYLKSNAKEDNRLMQEITGRSILFVEDNTELLSEMKNWFSAKGNIVMTADSLRKAKAILANEQPEMIVLDVVLPDGSGLELLENLVPLPPVVILSDLGNEENILDGLNAGVADYIVKPCSMRLLEARMRLRFLPQSESVVECGQLVVDSRRRTVLYAGKTVSLTSSEFNILWFLMKNPRTFFSADEIYERIWAAPSLQTTTIRRHLSTLRRKLKEFSEENIICTEFGKGYAFFPKEF